MPNFDKTGPVGRCQETGRKCGLCNPSPKAQSEIETIENTVNEGLKRQGIGKGQGGSGRGMGRRRRGRSCPGGFLD